MQVMPALAAASASLPAPPTAQVTAPANPFGEMLLALLTGVATGDAVPQLLSGDAAAEPEVETQGATKAADDDADAADDPAVLAGLGALMQAFAQPAVPLVQAEQSPAQPEAGEAPAAPAVTALPVAAEGAIAPAIVAAPDQAATTAVPLAIPDAGSEEAEPVAATAPEAVAVPLPRRLPLAAANTRVADGAGQAVALPETDSLEAEPLWATGVTVAEASADQAPVLAAAGTTTDQTDTAAENKGEAYARVAAAKRFPTAPATDPAAAAAAAPLQRAQAAVAEKATTAVDAGVRPAELIDRIAGQIKVTAETGGGEARIQLQPEHLGRIDISVKVQNGQVSVSLNADTPAVQHAINTRLPDLISALSASGMSVAQASVDAGDQSRQQRAWDQGTVFVTGSAEEDAATGSSMVDWLQPMSIVNLSA